MIDFTKPALSKLLQRRDGIDRWEADALIEDVQAKLDSILGGDISNPFDSIVRLERVIADNLRLEPDYLNCFDIY